MLVDLGRNDVGRIAKFGSVEVTGFMQIERYSHVLHIVSQVEGAVKENLSAVDFAAERSRSQSFVLDRSLMPAAFEGLLRMNVTARSLLPGLDGYARSMNHRLRLLLEIPLGDLDH